MTTAKVTQKELLQWMELCDFLRSDENEFMRPYVCVRCHLALLHDKDLNIYKVVLGQTRQEVEDIIQKIKSFNVNNR